MKRPLVGGYLTGARRELRSAGWQRVALLCVALAAGGAGHAGLAQAAGDAEVFDPGGQDEPVTPKPKKSTPPATSKPAAPKVADPIPGTWDIVEKGSITCAGSGTLVVTAKGGGYAGFMSWSLGEGPASVSVRGNKVHMVYEYVDLFGDKAKSAYDGTLSADRLSSAGTVAGEWDDGCTFIMQHR